MLLTNIDNKRNIFFLSNNMVLLHTADTLVKLQNQYVKIFKY